MERPGFIERSSDDTGIETTDDERPTVVLSLNAAPAGADHGPILKRQPSKFERMEVVPITAGAVGHIAVPPLYKTVLLKLRGDFRCAERRGGPRMFLQAILPWLEAAYGFLRHDLEARDSADEGGCRG